MLNAPTPTRCRSCGTDLAANLLACPACGALVFAEELKQLADSAARAPSPAEALACWRRAYALLPAGTRQQQAGAAKIDELVQWASSGTMGAAQQKKSGWGKAAGGVGVVAVFLSKFKFALFFLATKAKLLLLGLTKMSTLLSMFVSFGFYWSLWGWKFAAGFVLSIYIHEMGHVAMLARLGVKATAPMFIPGFGALIRMKEHLPTAREEALVGLAGPNWGLGAALAAWTLSFAFDSPLFAVIASTGAWINLFNLTPVWQLDGAHAWRAFTQTQRYIATGVVAAALFLVHSEATSILWLVLICSVVRLFKKDAAEKPDPRALADYVILIGALTFIAAAAATPR